MLAAASGISRIPMLKKGGVIEVVLGCKWRLLERTGKAVGYIVCTDHERVKTGKDGANGEEVVPLMQDRHIRL
jgi:hypothetical protein